MANYIYNDNFSDINDNKPEKESSKTLSKKAFIIIACVAVFVLMMLSLVLGVILGNTLARKHPVNAMNTANTIYTAPPSDKLPSNDHNVSSVVSAVSGCVVQIKTEFLSSTAAPGALKQGGGSGVIFSTYSENKALAGYNIVTNIQVIQDKNASKIASNIEVTINDGTKYNATVVGYDKDFGIAVIRIAETKKDIKCATFATSNSFRAGDTAISIGYPLVNGGATVTTGIISALPSRVKIDSYTTMDFLQADVSINPGDNGGALFDMNGRLVGILNTKISSSNISGIAFATPAPLAQTICTDILQHGYVQNKPYIGVEFKKYLDATVRVEEITYDFNEDVLKKGDKILTVNGIAILDGAQIYEMVKDCKAGDALMFVIIRDDVELAVAVNIFNYIPLN